MVRLINEQLADIVSSLRGMKECLHSWDDVDNQIDAKLKAIEAVQKQPTIDPKTVEEFAKQRDRLRRLTFREIYTNIDNMEKGATALKITAAVGIGVPAGFFAWKLGAVGALVRAAKVAGPKILQLAKFLVSKTRIVNTKVAYGIPAVISTASLASVALHSSMNETAKIKHDLKRTTGFLGQIEKFKEESCEGEVLQISAKESDQLWEDAKNRQDPLVHHYYTQLVAQAFNSKLPESAQFMNPITLQEDTRPVTGNIVTMYRTSTVQKALGLDHNLCVRLGKEGERKPLLCDPQSNHWFHKSGVESKEVKSVEIEWADSNHHKAYALQAQSFAVNQRYVPADQGVQWIAEHIGHVSFVEHLLPKIYEGLFLPEAACAVTHILLNIFMLSEEINSDVKLYYVNLLDSVLKRFGKRLDQQQFPQIRESAKTGGIHFGECEGKKCMAIEIPNASTPKTVIIDLNREAGWIKKAWNVYAVWLQQHLPQDVYDKYKQTQQENIQKVEGDFPPDLEVLKVYLLNEEFTKQYATSVTQSYGAMVGPYIASIQSPTDLFAARFVNRRTDTVKIIGDEESWGILDIGIFGWMGGSLFLKEFKGWPGHAVKVAWAGSFVLTVHAIASWYQFEAPAFPLPLHLPALNGLASQEYLNEFQKRLDAGAKEGAKEMEALKEKMSLRAP